MPERFKGPVLKTGVRFMRTVSSNLTPTAYGNQKRGYARFYID